MRIEPGEKVRRPLVQPTRLRSPLRRLGRSASSDRRAAARARSVSFGRCSAAVQPRLTSETACSARPAALHPDLERLDQRRRARLVRHQPRRDPLAAHARAAGARARSVFPDSPQTDRLASQRRTRPSSPARCARTSTRTARRTTLPCGLRSSAAGSSALGTAARRQGSTPRSRAAGATCHRGSAN